MDKFNININVEVSLSKATIDALGSIFGGSIHVGKPVTNQAEAPEVKKQAAPQPAPEPAPAPVSKSAVEGDLPPTEAEMRAAIKATRERGVPTKSIKDYIKNTFGVDSSIECPMERRQELIDGLEKLVA